MLELRVKTGRRFTPIFDIPTVLGRSGARREIGDTIESLIAFMDDLDGDPDIEDATDVEDDFHLTSSAILSWSSDGPGCPVSDAGGCQHDDREPSWTEASSLRGRPAFGGISDDDEANGDHEGVDEDTELNGDEGDCNGAEDDFVYHGHSGPGCPVSDPGGGTEGQY